MPPPRAGEVEGFDEVRDADEFEDGCRMCFSVAEANCALKGDVGYSCGGEGGKAWAG